MMRGWALGLGLGSLAVAWLGPLPELAERSFAAHMTMHVTVVAVAAPLIALGLAGRRWDLARLLPGAFAPMPASALELVVVWAWHAPALHRAARAETAALLAEQATFLAAALLVWLSAFGGDPRGRGARGGAGIGALLMTSMHMTLLGALLALSPRPLYGHAGVEDQQLGGVIMLLAGGSSYLAGGLYLLAGLLRPAGPGRR